MSAIQRHQERWIWFSSSRENGNRIRGTLNAADSPPYGVLLHESRQEREHANYSQTTDKNQPNHIPNCQETNLEKLASLGRQRTAKFRPASSTVCALAPPYFSMGRGNFSIPNNSSHLTRHTQR